MHKYFLTRSECAVIQGADAIIERFGGFPSMEDGCLRSIVIQAKNGKRRYRVELTFDISGWKRATKQYIALKDTDENLITMCFDGAIDLEISSPSDYWDCGEMKFDNFHGTEKLNQDESPCTVLDYPRPYTRFYSAGHPGKLVIEFEESECCISAWINN